MAGLIIPIDELAYYLEKNPEAQLDIWMNNGYREMNLVLSKVEYDEQRKLIRVEVAINGVRVNHG